MGRRAVLLVAACVIAALGAGLIFMYANSSGDASASETTQVYVAKAQIEAGTSGTAIAQGAVEQRAFPINMVPTGAVTNLADVTGKTTMVTILPGQVLLNGQFSKGNVTGGLPIPAGKLAVSVELGDPQRVAGFVQPGSSVAVFSTTNGTASVLLANAYVVAVGPAVVTAGATESDKKDPIVTFALSEADAAKLIGATGNGSALYLGLIGRTS